MTYDVISVHKYDLWCYKYISMTYDSIWEFAQNWKPIKWNWWSILE